MTHHSNFGRKLAMTLSRLIRTTALLLVAVLLSDSVAFAAKKPVDPAVMKAKILAHGVGQGVRVTFADKTETKGLIVAIDDRTFTLRTRKTAEERQIEYAQLTGVHKDHLSRGQKVGIAVGVVAGVAVILGVIVAVQWDKGFNFKTIDVPAPVR
jgi:hypothetical protein